MSMHDRATESPARLVILSLGLVLLTAGCLGAGDAISADSPVPHDDVEPAGEPQDAPPGGSEPSPSEDPVVANSGEASAQESPSPRIVTRVYEREGKAEPHSYVGGGEHYGYASSYLRVPVPAKAVAVRAVLFWNGSGSLDLGVLDERARCGLIDLVTCQVRFAAQMDGEGWHWVVDGPSPAMLTFDESAIRDGCTGAECAWGAYAYSKGDLDTTFHLRVEVDTVEQDESP